MVMKVTRGYCGQSVGTATTIKNRFSLASYLSVVDVAEFIGDTLSYIMSAWYMHCPLVQIRRIIARRRSKFQHSGADDHHQKRGAVPRHIGVA